MTAAAASGAMGETVLDLDRLLTMANQIGDFFEPYPPARRAEGDEAGDISAHCAGSCAAATANATRGRMRIALVRGSSRGAERRYGGI